MRNVECYNLKKCILMRFESYARLISKLTNGLKEVKYEYDGMYHSDTDKAIEEEKYWNEDILKTLSNYFDVEVTSVHTDDCDVLGVWICYKEN